MTFQRWAFRISLFSAATLVSFSPVGFSADRGLAASTGQCETCCPEDEATCIVCGTKSCVKSDSYYEAKIGSPCAAQIAPSVPG